MSNSSEIERIRRVYRGYQESGYAARMWSGSNLGNQAISEERARALQNALSQTGFLPLTNRTILDIGCGSGAVLQSLNEWGASTRNLFGVDLLGERLAVAQFHHQNLQLQQGNGAALAWQASVFDLVFVFTVFSSVLDASMRQRIANEASRVLKPGGAVVWYDFRVRNPNNPHTRPFSKVDILALFPGFRAHLWTLTLLPPLARRLGRLTGSLYPLLSSISLLHTHHLGILIKPLESIDVRNS